MEALYATTTGLLAACGVYLTLRGRTFPVVVGLTLLSYAVNLFLFSMAAWPCTALPPWSAQARPRQTRCPRHWC